MPALDGAAEAWAAGYDRMYAAMARDPLALHLHRRVLGPEYPEGIAVTGECTPRDA